MVARLTPDQKVACSIHVGFNSLYNRFVFYLLLLLLLLLLSVFKFFNCCDYDEGEEDLGFNFVGSNSRKKVLT